MKNTLVKHYSIKTPEVESPGREWIQRWHGLYELTDSQCNISSDEYQLETNVFLNIVESIRDKNIVFVELGAGSASWCLALNGIVRNKLVNTHISEITCYAVEADPTHIDWIKRHFKTWDIKGTVIPCAISERNGYCKFTTGKPNWYGQSIVTGNGILRTLYKSIMLKTVKVQCLRLDTLVVRYHISKVNIAHMDIQGSEYDVIKGARKTVKTGIIDYWIIGTHNKKYNELIAQEMKDYELLLDLYPNSTAEFNGSRYRMQDGMQVYKKTK